MVVGAFCKEHIWELKGPGEHGPLDGLAPKSHMEGCPKISPAKQTGVNHTCPQNQ
jgi:hypothetical protein